MPPARLNDTHLGIGEIGNRLLEKVWRWYEIGVEDGHELPTNFCKADCQRSGLVTGTPLPTAMPDSQSSRSELPGDFAKNVCGLISGIVQQLDLKPIDWVI